MSMYFEIDNDPIKIPMNAEDTITPFSNFMRAHSSSNDFIKSKYLKHLDLLFEKINFILNNIDDSKNILFNDYNKWYDDALTIWSSNII